MKALRKSIFLLLIISFSASAEKIEKCPSTPYQLPEAKGYHHMKYAPNHKGRLYDGKAFVASIDTIDDDNGDGNIEYLAQPEWVSVHLKAYDTERPSGYAPGFKRPGNWYKLKIFDEERKYYKTKKSIDESYDGIGKVWNRGHLAQRADANRISEEYGCNTHVFANAVPQAAKFNQGIWMGLENYVASISNEVGELWVVSGPIYIPGQKIEYIGEPKKNEVPVAIPDKMFKVIFVELDDGSGVQVYSLIYPNKFDELPELYKKGRCNEDKTYDHNPYLVSLAQVEVESGIKFFPDVEMDLSTFKNVKAEYLPFLKDNHRVGYCQ